MLYFVEYMQAGSGLPVDLTIGLHNKPEAIVHARRVAAQKGYCGFWISSKPCIAGVDPKRLEYHPLHFDPSGKVTYGRVLYVKHEA